MPVTRRLEWNGNNNILVLEDGHGRVDITLDDFLQMAADITADLQISVLPAPHRPQPPRQR
jgi:hypothetical protein